MKREDIETLRENVACQAVLAEAGFALDVKESTKRALKFRRGGEIIIVTHAGRGWFDPLSEEKGDVFSLIALLQGCDFIESCERLATLAGVLSVQAIWDGPDRKTMPQASIAERWARRSAPWPGSATWRYLCEQRCIPASVIRAAIDQRVLRQGPMGSMWAAHTDEAGMLSGWEARGPEWRGFATGGAKVLFRFGFGRVNRLCVTEAAIDAMSLAAIEGMRDGTAYLSTGGGWAPATGEALRVLAAQPATQLVAATDSNLQGDAYADRLRGMANDVGCEWLRLRPASEDWNAVLKQRERKNTEKEMEDQGVPHSRQPHQGRLRPAVPALDPANGQVGGEVRVMKD